MFLTLVLLGVFSLVGSFSVASELVKVSRVAGVSAVGFCFSARVVSSLARVGALEIKIKNDFFL